MAQRDGNGRFAPGHSGNPRGTNGYARIREKLEAEVARAILRRGPEHDQERLRILAEELVEGLPPGAVPGRKLLLEVIGALSQKLELQHVEPPTSPQYVPTAEEQAAVEAALRDGRVVH